MVEATLLNYLASCLTVPVYMEVPEDIPESFAVLEKVSGGMTDHIYSASFAIQSYAKSMYDAACLNEEIKGHMLYGAVPDEICSVRLNSDYNYTDLNTKRYRYQAVYDIKHY